MIQFERKSRIAKNGRILPVLNKLLLQVCIASLFIGFQIGCTPISYSVNSIKNPNSQVERSASTSILEDDQSISTGNLTPDQISTLSSLKKVDDYPLYTMHHQGFYKQDEVSFRLADGNVIKSAASRKDSDWACSLFAALGDDEESKFGRNFDWEYSPALVLFTAPPGKYASVSIVDLAYLGFESHEIGKLHEMELVELTPLLDAPNWPFDGINARGLAIGMAAVPSAQMETDLQKPSIGSLEIMRRILDNAADIHEAVSIMGSYNIDFRDGPALHYLIADQSGEAVLVEFFGGEMHLIPNEDPWHLATNFLISSVNDPQGQCKRYDKISDTMQENGGNLIPQNAHELLSSVSQNNTQWSVVYNLHTIDIEVTMGRQFDQSHKFQLIP